MTTSRSAEPFRIVTRLGSGGMGDVYLATRTTGERVALKRIRWDRQRDAQLRAQFEREARICSLLRHENIVSLREFDEDEHGPFLALEYIDGCSASTLLRAAASSGRQLPIGVAASIALDCARALEYAHGFTDPAAELHGVIHRDLSPDNILVDQQGVAKLADFGIAKILGETRLTSTGVAKGKFGYLAPEIYEGHEADALTDTFAFASTLFHLFCGVSPFRGKTEAEMMRATLLAQPPRPSHLRPGLPAAVDEWIHLGLSRDRSHRPSGFSSLLTAARDALGGEPAGIRREVAQCVREALAQPGLATPDGPRPVSRPTTLDRGPGREDKRGRRWILLACLAGVVAVAIAAGFAFRSRPASVAAAPTTSNKAPPSPVLGSTEESAPPALASPPVPAPAPAAQRHAEPIRATTRGGRPPTPHAQRHPVAAAAEPSAPPTELWIRVHPWANVFLDGESLGATPLTPREVSPGTHSVMLVNDKLHVRRTYQVEALPHQSNEFRVTLDSEVSRLHDP